MENAMVTRLNVNNLYNDIMTLLNSKTLNTRKAYEGDLKQFFMYMHGKQLNELVPADLRLKRDGTAIKYVDILQYQQHLQNSMANATVNRKINAIRSLYSKLKKNEYDVNLDIFDVDKLETTDSETIGFLSYDEALQLVELAGTHLDSGVEKSLLFELAIKTSIRLSALLSIRWKNIKKKENYWLISVVDKGKKKTEKPITEQFYQRLLLLKEKGNKDYLFTWSERWIQEEFKKLCGIMKIDKDRNVSFHSLRKVAAMYEIEVNGDVIAAKNQMNHSSATTTLKWYVDSKRDFSTMAGITMEEELDMSVLDNMNADELRTLINQASLRTKRELLKLTKKINN